MKRSKMVLGSWVLLLGLGAWSAGCQKEAGAGDAAPVASEDAAPKPTEPPTAPAPDAAEPATAAATPDTAAATDAAPEPPDTAAAEAEALEEKIKALAVASECLRKQGVTPEQASQTMLALYRAHGIELDVYTREMGRLAGDPKFQEAVQAALAACPAAPVVVQVDAGAAPEADAGATTVVAEADAAPATVADTAPATVADTAPATVADSAPATVADTAPATVADTRPATVADTAPATVADTAPTSPPDAGTSEPPTEPSKLTGTWTGALAGKGAGSLRMTVTGRTVTSAVATFGRIKVTLKGSITDKGLVTLSGRNDNDFVRVNANVDKAQTVISGTWTGTIDKKKVGGNLRMTK